MPKTTKWKSRRWELKDNYLSGRARKRFTHGPILNSLLQEDVDLEQPLPSGTNASVPGESSSVCSKCRSILSRYSDILKGLIHQGSELKKRIRLNPHPKRPDMTHYRDLKRQNDWIRENLFDPMGNYLYCCPCIHASLGLSRQRLARQRAIKRKQSQELFCNMTKALRNTTKAEVEEEGVSEFVVMPASLNIAFKEWWYTLEHAHTFMVRYPHKRHGNSGRKSNSSKES